jgi:5'-nucleotidase
VKRRPNILVVNDDGVYGEGLRPLAKALGALGRVTVVVPEKEQSAVSHAITLHKPIRLRRIEKDFYIINGTPADCSRFGALRVLQGKPDLVVSGVNRGANMGADTLYSGTVGAAKEACFLGFPAMAVSLVQPATDNFDAAARAARRLAGLVLRHGLPPNVCLNVNVPDRPWRALKGAALTFLGKRVYGRDHVPRLDPRGQAYFWMAGHVPKGIPTPGSDLAAVRDGKISVTPVRLDITDGEALVSLRSWPWDSLFRS